MSYDAKEKQKSLSKKITAITPQRLKDAATFVGSVLTKKYMAEGVGLLMGGAMSFGIIALIDDYTNTRENAQDAFDAAIATPEGAPDVNIVHAGLIVRDENFSTSFVDFYNRASSDIVWQKNENGRYFGTFGDNRQELDFVTDESFQQYMEVACNKAERLSNLDSNLDRVEVRADYLQAVSEETTYPIEYLRLMGNFVKDKHCGPSGP